MAEASAGGELQSQIDELARRLTAGESRIQALGARADESDANSLIDRDMIAELQSAGELSRDSVEHLETALKSSRKIGAAVGILMASRGVDETQAFAILKKVSQDSNRKLRDLASDLVASHAAPADPPGAGGPVAEDP